MQTESSKFGQYPTKISQRIGTSSAVPEGSSSAVNIFRHLTQKLLDTRRYACIVLMLPDVLPPVGKASVKLKEGLTDRKIDCLCAVLP